MDKEVYDIVVIGLGPAGSIFSQCLKKDYKVLALDKKINGETSSFKKPCGGLLAPDAQKALAEFKLTLPKSVLASPQIFSVETLDLAYDITRHYQRFYLNLDRHKFDEWLKEGIPSSIEVVSGSVVTDIKRRANDFEVEYCVEGEKHRIYSKHIVGADGAHSIVANKLGLKRKVKSYVAIQEWYEIVEDTPFYSCYFDHRITNSYCWGLAKDNIYIFGGAFYQKTAKASFQKLKEEVEAKGIVFGKQIKREVCQVLKPDFIGGCQLGKDNAFLIGEAAGFISPSSLEGISYALRSGMILADVFNKDQGHGYLNKNYRKKVKKVVRKVQRKNLKRPFMYWPKIRKAVMLSGLSSIDIRE